MKNHKYELTDYFDVWGNEEDGFEVNNLSHEIIETEKDVFDLSDDQIILFLKDIKYLNPDAKGIVIVNYSDLIEIELENGFPLGRIMYAYDERQVI